MLPPLSPVPSISIHFAPIDEPVAPEPASPFDRTSFTSSKPTKSTRSKTLSPLVSQFSVPDHHFGEEEDDEDDEEDEGSLRPVHLAPPPLLSPKQVAALSTRQAQAQSPRSPLSNSNGANGVGGAGLDRDKFEALLNSSKSSTGGAKLDLRKEVTIKAHASKHLERRALFLSKTAALPSPTAACLPVTPPESPAVFHFTLPSPGLASPLAVFDNGNKVERRLRVEEVDFRAKARKEAEELARLTGNIGMSWKFHGLGSTLRTPTSGTTRKGLPSLDEISKRLSNGGSVVGGAVITVKRAEAPAGAENRLPAFLKKRSTPSTPAAAPAAAVPAPVVHQAEKVVSETTPSVTAPSVPTLKVDPPSGPSSTASTSPNNSTLQIPGKQTVSAHAEAYRPRAARPSSLTNLPSMMNNDNSKKSMERTEKGSVMVERLRRRVSAPPTNAPKHGAAVAQTGGAKRIGGVGSVFQMSIAPRVF